MINGPQPGVNHAGQSLALAAAGAAGQLMIDVTEAGEIDIPGVLRLYGEAGYGGAVNNSDTTIIAKCNGKIVGAVRLCPEEGATVLRGMQVARAFQRRGIGAQLLAACRSTLNDSMAYCLPYAHLASFYGAEQFEAISPTELPDFLQHRLATYVIAGRDVIAMRRSSPSGDCPPRAGSVGLITGP